MARHYGMSAVPTTSPRSREGSTGRADWLQQQHAGGWRRAQGVRGLVSRPEGGRDRRQVTVYVKASAKHSDVFYCSVCRRRRVDIARNTKQQPSLAIVASTRLRFRRSAFTEVFCTTPGSSGKLPHQASERASEIQHPSPRPRPRALPQRRG